MTLQLCPECKKLTEHNGDFCTQCGFNCTKSNLLEIIEKQDKIIADLEAGMQNSEFILTTIDFLSNYNSSHIYN